MHQSREALNQKKLKVQSQEAKNNTETQPGSRDKVGKQRHSQEAETQRGNRYEYRDTVRKQR